MRFPRLKVQFSLRFMIATVVVCAIVFYWMALPTINAYRFKAAMEAGDFAAAERMFPHGDRGDPTKFGDFDYVLNERDLDIAKDLLPLPTNFGSREELLEAVVTVRPLNWRSLWRGERQVEIQIRYESEGDMWYTICGTRRGMGSEIGLCGSGNGPKTDRFWDAIHSVRERERKSKDSNNAHS